jgi:large subunit ribosomal protein L32
MAVPKHKTSKSKRDMRRSHQNLEAPSLSTCPECGETKLPHHVCPNCGQYKGKQVTEGKED